VKQTTLTVIAGVCGNADVGVEVDVAHFARLDLPVFRVILDDAKRVDPNVLDSECSVDVEGVAKGQGQDTCV
jgi:hypothetical protein